MPTAQKAKTIEQAKDWYARSAGVVFTDYRGLKVKEFQKLRSELAAKGAEIHVIKNTLFRIAAGDDAALLPDELHNGPTAVAFIYENETENAKVLVEYAKASKTFEVKGGFIGGKVLSAQQVEELSKLPPREVLIAQVIGAIAAPLTHLVGVIEALYADPIRVIGAVADKVAEGSPLPVAEAQTEAPAQAEEAPAAEVTAEAPVEAAPADESAAPAEAPAEAPTEESAPEAQPE